MIAAFETRLPKPWLAVGHSMGGCLTALVLARGEHRFAGAVLSAPMLGLQTAPTPPAVTRVLAQTLTLIGAGGASTPGSDAASFESNILTHDPRRYARNVGQIAAYPDLALGPPTWSWLAFAFAAIAELQRGPGVPKVDIPVTIVAAGEDRIIDNAGTRLVPAASLKAATSKPRARSTSAAGDRPDPRGVLARVRRAAGQIAPA